MMPDLFSGVAASAATYLPVPAETSAPTAPCTGKSDVFAALLADTMAPAPGATGFANAPSTSASVPLADFWFNALIGGSPTTGIPGSESDEGETSTENGETGTEDAAIASRDGGSEDVSGLASAVPMPVPILVPLTPPPAMTASACETTPQASVSDPTAPGLPVAQTTEGLPLPSKQRIAAAEFVRPAGQGVTEQADNEAPFARDAEAVPSHAAPAAEGGSPVERPLHMHAVTSAPPAEQVKATPKDIAAKALSTDAPTQDIASNVGIHPSEAPASDMAEPAAEETGAQSSRAAVALAAAVAAKEQPQQKPAEVSPAV